MATEPPPPSLSCLQVDWGTLGIKLSILYSISPVCPSRLRGPVLGSVIIAWRSPAGPFPAEVMTTKERMKCCGRPAHPGTNQPSLRSPPETTNNRPHSSPGWRVVGGCQAEGGWRLGNGGVMGWTVVVRGLESGYMVAVGGGVTWWCMGQLRLRLVRLMDQ